MSRLSSRFSSAAVLLCFASILHSGDAQAQACCAGGGAFAPARLKLYEDAIIGVQVRANSDLGSFDGTGHYARYPAGFSELDLEQDIIGGYRFNEHIQAGLLIPFVETRRVVPGLSEFGGGLGDITVHGRFDIILPAQWKFVPGVAIVAAITAPSGRPLDEVHTTLATGATGRGFWQGAIGLSLEELIGPWVIDAGASVWEALPRTSEGTTELLGVQVSGRFALGYAFKHGSALAVTLAYKGGVDSTIDGTVVPGTGQNLLTAGLAGGLPINSWWRLQAALSYDLPVAGRNQVAGIGGTFTVLRAF